MKVVIVGGVAKDFMLRHGYIKRDFDVEKWAAPEFLEKAARELVEERWRKVTTAKLPSPSTTRLG
jgi:hypothetical protein